MGSIMSTPKPPPIPVAAPPQAAPATLADASVATVGANTKARGAAAAAQNADNPTGGRGLTDEVSTNKATLLGGTR